MVVLGFGIVYLAFALALVAVVAGVLGVGTGIYFKQWPGVATGFLGIELMGCGVSWVTWSLAHF